MLTVQRQRRLQVPTPPPGNGWSLLQAAMQERKSKGNKRDRSRRSQGPPLWQTSRFPMDVRYVDHTAAAAGSTSAKHG